MLPPVSSAQPLPSPTAKDPDLWVASQALEATFLSEMLKSAGLGAARDSFGGGAGEAPFAGFLADEYARSLADRGGIGMAESIYRTLVQRGGG